MHVSIRQLLAFCLLANTCLLAQTPAPSRPSFNYESAVAERVATAVRISDEIRIDGRLEESAWDLASPATDFYQWARIGQPATNKTEARFLYDDENLYVGVNMWDADIDKRVVNELKEDYNFRDTDGVSIILDTLNDNRSGFIFGTNPAGARRDGQVSN